MAPGRTQQLLLYAASLRKPRRERKKCKQPSAGKGEWFALRWFRLGSVSFFLAVHETWCDWWGPIIAPDLWYVMAYLISNMIFAICKYFLPFDGRPWHRFEWLAHSDMGLTAKWLCQPGKCFQLPHPSPPKKKHIPKWAQQGFKHRCGCTCCACMYA